MMITRQVRCKKCGNKFPLTYPEKLSDIGLDLLSYCPNCSQIRNPGESGKEKK